LGFGSFRANETDRRAAEPGGALSSSFADLKGVPQAARGDKDPGRSVVSRCIRLKSKAGPSFTPYD